MNFNISEISVSVKDMYFTKYDTSSRNRKKSDGKQKQ